jgi:hypothetical protein
MNVPDYKSVTSDYNKIKGDFGENRVTTCYRDAEAKRDFVNKIYDKCLSENPDQMLEIEEQRYEACKDILCDMYTLLFDVYIAEELYTPKLRDTIHKAIITITDEEVQGDAVTADYEQIWNTYVQNAKYVDNFIWLAKNDKTFDENCILA